MNLIFAPGQNYECIKCAKGCTEQWDIGVNSKCYNAVKGSAVELRVIQERGTPGMEAFPPHRAGRVVGRVENNRCLFLAPDNLCDIHRELGIESKPLPCREFPFVYRDTPDGVLVGTTYFCTSAQQNTGRPLAEHAEEAMAILGDRKPDKIGYEPLPVIEGYSIDWPSYKELEAQVDKDCQQSVAGALSKVVRALTSFTMTPPPSKDPAAAGAHLLELYQHSKPNELHFDPMMASQLDFFIGAVAGVIEVGRNVEHQRICHAFTHAESYEMPRLGAEVDFSVARMQRLDIEQDFSEPIVRYFRSLLFRKFLVHDRSLLEGAVLAYLANRLLTLYTSLYAQKNGRDPEQEDLFKAMDLVEADLITHAQGYEALVSTMANATVSFLALDMPTVG